MFVPSGTVGNYLFAFWDLVDVRLDVVRGDVYRARDVTLGVLLRCVGIDEDGGLGIEIFLRLGQRDPRGIAAVRMAVVVVRRSGRSRTRRPLDGNRRSGIRARGDHECREYE